MARIDRDIDKQSSGIVVDILNLQREEALNNALQEVDKIKDILKVAKETNYGNLLGSDKTKHGEIAEFIEVHIRNAKELLQKRNPIATFEGVGRTADTDYILNNVGVQSKFINGCNSNLTHVLKHLDKYPNFCADNSHYIIPKDHLEIINDVYSGKDLHGLNNKSVNAILEKVKEIENQTGKQFDEVVQPSISKYGEVQQGTAEKTVEKHEKEIIEGGQASINEALKAGAISAGISGGMNLAFNIYKNHKQGKKIQNYTAEDWKKIGIDFAKSSTEGGLSGMAIYGLTNLTDMSAPLASAFVSSSIGVASLANSYHKGEIEYDDFVEQSNAVCTDAAMVGLAATIGQAVIPIPIVGTLVGTFAMKATLSFTRDYLGKQSKEFEERLNNDYSKHLKTINEELKIEVEKIVNEYDKLGQISDMAFDFNRNAYFRFKASIELAEKSGVEEKKIIRSDEDLDKFILS